ncbi:hypothetical protein AURDEDRAFT_157249 [Auricularia subglabra TFB-10046 SS5]|nr:hypothetical protein AURDEDRAFT_157249 [Auricularia subglabra TFB-10046 SS5]
MSGAAAHTWPTVRHIEGAHTHAVVIITATAAVLSGLLVLLLLTHILVVGLFPYMTRGSKYSHEGERAFLWRPIGALVTSLLLSNLLQAISGLFQILWAHKGAVYLGPSCTVQGSFLLSGDVGVSFFSMLVAMHTFWTVALHKSWPSWVLWTLISLAWALMLIITLLGPYVLQETARGPFYGIAKEWCFINNNYAAGRIYLQYIAILVAACVITILYILVFLTVRGQLTLYGWRRGATLRSVLPRAQVTQIGNVHLPSPTLAATANKMLWYPAAYIVIILPLSTARLCAETGRHVPEWVWHLAIIFLYLTGTFNVLIYTSTRKALSPIGWRRRSSATSSSWLRRGSAAPSLTGKLDIVPPPPPQIAEVHAADHLAPGLPPINETPPPTDGTPPPVGESPSTTRRVSISASDTPLR